ncbi:hypothetical protein Tco_0969786 [Tanacetum coccineum]
MRRKGRFSQANTPLFSKIFWQIHAEEGEGSGQPYKPQPTPSPDQSFHEEQLSDIPSSSQLQKTQKHRKGRKLSNRGNEGITYVGRRCEQVVIAVVEVVNAGVISTLVQMSKTSKAKSIVFEDVEESAKEQREGKAPMVEEDVPPPKKTQK